MGRIIFVLLLHLITILKLTLIERGDHLRTCVSTCVLHLCLLVVVVIEGIANTHHLAENPIKQSPLCDVSTGEETDAKQKERNIIPTAVLSQSLIDLRAVMSLALPARQCYQSSRD